MMHNNVRFCYQKTTFQLRWHLRKWPTDTYEFDHFPASGNSPTALAVSPANGLAIALDFLGPSGSRSFNHSCGLPLWRLRGESPCCGADTAPRTISRSRHQQANCGSDCARREAPGLGDQSFLYRNRVLECYRARRLVCETALARKIVEVFSALLSLLTISYPHLAGSLGGATSPNWAFTFA